MSFWKLRSAKTPTEALRNLGQWRIGANGIGHLILIKNQLPHTGLICC
jgi:hypothetical protein